MVLLKNKVLSCYIDKKMSAADIAHSFKCSEQMVNYWLKKYNIPKRSISDAMYLKHNPKGDPFKIKKPATMKEAELFGLGVGLYWGEGTKSNKTSVRLGNTDPYLVKHFILFLDKICGIKRKKLKFGLQVFSDMRPNQARSFWQRAINAHRDQFQKVIVTPARSIGTYRQKTRHGVLTIYYNNKKLRDILCSFIDELKK